MYWEEHTAALLSSLPESLSGSAVHSRPCGCGPGWAAREEGPVTGPEVSEVTIEPSFWGIPGLGPQIRAPTSQPTGCLLKWSTQMFAWHRAVATAVQR